VDQGAESLLVGEGRDGPGDGGFAASSVHVDRDGARVLPETPLQLHNYLTPTSWQMEIGFPAALPVGTQWTDYLDDVLLETY
jgi:hypothetical protein